MSNTEYLNYNQIGGIASPVVLLSMELALGENIRKIRQHLGFSQEFVSDRLGISQSAYANIETGKTKVNIERLIQLAKIFEVNYSTIIEGDKISAKRIKHQESGELEEILDSYKKQIAILEENIKDKNYIIDLLKKQAEK